MTDDPVRTRLRTPQGWLDFQDYFVAAALRAGGPRDRLCRRRDGAAASGFPGRARRSSASARSSICPSNPFISIDPILALPGVREALRACRAPVVAVSPIIGGKAVKGPTAKMMEELGLPVDAAAVARHYADLLDLYVIDTADADQAAAFAVPVVAARTLMQTLADREALARTVLERPSGF